MWDEQIGWIRDYIEEHGYSPAVDDASVDVLDAVLENEAACDESSIRQWLPSDASDLPGRVLAARFLFDLAASSHEPELPQFMVDDRQAAIRTLSFELLDACRPDEVETRVQCQWEIAAATAFRYWERVDRLCESWCQQGLQERRWATATRARAFVLHLMSIESKIEWQGFDLAQFLRPADVISNCEVESWSGLGELALVLSAVAVESAHAGLPNPRDLQGAMIDRLYEACSWLEKLEAEGPLGWCERALFGWMLYAKALRVNALAEFTRAGEQFMQLASTPEAIRSTPVKSKALSAATSCFLQGQQLDRARRACTAWCESQPDDSAPYLRMAEIAWKLNHVDDATHFFEKAVKNSAVDENEWLTSFALQNALERLDVSRLLEALRANASAELLHKFAAELLKDEWPVFSHLCEQSSQLWTAGLVLARDRGTRARVGEIVFSQAGQAIGESVARELNQRVFEPFRTALRAGAHRGDRAGHSWGPIRAVCDGRRATLGDMLEVLQGVHGRRVECESFRKWMETAKRDLFSLLSAGRALQFLRSLDTVRLLRNEAVHSRINSSQFEQLLENAKIVLATLVNQA